MVARASRSASAHLSVVSHTCAELRPWLVFCSCKHFFMRSCDFILAQKYALQAYQRNTLDRKTWETDVTIWLVCVCVIAQRSARMFFRLIDSYSDEYFSHYTESLIIIAMSVVITNDSNAFQASLIIIVLTSIHKKARMFWMKLLLMITEVYE